MNRIPGFVTVLIFLLLAALALWAFGSSISKVAYGDITAAFACDLADYVENHKGSLPENWREFSDWSAENTEKKGYRTKWNPEKLAKRFAIRVDQVRNQPDIPVYVEVLDPSIAPMQELINRRIHETQIHKQETRTLP